MNENLRRHIDALVASNDHEGLLDLGSELLKVHDYASAEQVARAVLDSGSPRAIALLAITLDYQGRTGEAEAAYREAIAAGDASSLTQLADMLLYDNSRLGEAEELARRAVERGLITAHFVLGKVLARQPGREAEAEAAFAAENNPAIKPIAQFQLAQLLADLPGREADTERALRASGLPDAQAQLAGLLRGKPGHEEEALEAMRQAAENGVPHAWNNLTFMLRELGRSDSAEAAYRDGLARGEAELIPAYGDFLRLQGRAAEAEQVLRLGLPSDPRCAFVLGAMLTGDPSRVGEGRELLITAAGAGIVDAAIHLAHRR